MNAWTSYPHESHKMDESLKKKTESDENGNGPADASKSRGSNDATAKNRSEFGLAETQNLGPA